MPRVAAALIWDGNRFMICQRPAHKARGLLWEFVGGKLEQGETAAEALVRECREELGVTVAVGDVFMELCHEYPDMTVELTLFNARIAEGTPQLLEHNDIRWITVPEIPEYSFCPADEEILVRLMERDFPVLARLFALRDEKYRDFQCKLMPTVNPKTVIGVRTPKLRALARELNGTDAAKSLLSVLPHRYYEENNLHGFLIERIRDYDECVAAIDEFLPYVDNWATCDLISPKVFKKHLPKLLSPIRRWLASDETYTVRFGIEMLMSHYLDGEFLPEYAELVAAVKSDEYYVKMMVAWYFATALAKQYDAVLPYIEEHRLPKWTHNKAIQKAIESYRVTDAQKAYLRTQKL